MNVLRIIFLYFFTNAVLATTSLGGMANNIISPVNVLSDFINSGCLLIGGAFVFSSIIKYIEHRRSPLMVPISTVIFLFIAGLVLLLLPLTSLLTENGLPFSLFR